MSFSLDVVHTPRRDSERSDADASTKKKEQINRKKLEPFHKKIVLIESKRIITVFNILLANIKLLFSYKTILSNVDETNNEDDSIEFLKTHETLENDLMNQKPEKISQDMKQLFLNSTKNLLRYLNNKYESQIDNFYQLAQVNLNFAEKNLVKKLYELKDYMNERLLLTPIEMKFKKNFIRQISEQNDSNQTSIKKLETELFELCQKREMESAEKKKKIQELQRSIYHIQKYSTEYIVKLKNENQTKIANEKKISDEKRSKLQLEYSNCSTNKQNLINENRTSEYSLRKVKSQYEINIQDIISKYDNVMEKRQEEYEIIETKYIAEKKQLEELQERFTEIEIEYDSIILNQKLKKEKDERNEFEKKMKLRAAHTIQAFWRSYKVRKSLKTKKKKGKNKK
ncbi:IQ domain-containing protein D [Intoshia linei]|uniref:Dynein regulatory complex protein 10 n=1 Tax=Intoshia linei TaxID=1819745 RepID=A0A177AZB1_9BILA|nr:IQ domain-containing protein D [Intoshia linei]